MSLAEPATDQSSSGQGPLEGTLSSPRTGCAGRAAGFGSQVFFSAGGMPLLRFKLPGVEQAAEEESLSTERVVFKSGQQFRDPKLD